VIIRRADRARAKIIPQVAQALLVTRRVTHCVN